MEPTVLALENEFHGKVEFIIVDVDDPQGQQLAGRFGVGTIPAFFIMDGKGNMVFEDVGTFDKRTLAKKIKEAIDR
jgi:cytochrome c-type biogenesis protein